MFNPTAPVNEQLASYSDLFMLIAALVYAGAFILFAIDMAVSSSTIARLERELADEREASGLAARGADEAQAELVDDDMEYTGTGRRPIANVAVAVTGVGWALHAFAVIARGIAASRVPWGNLYEFMTTGAVLVITVYLAFLFRKDLRFVGTFVSGLVVAMMCAATMGFPTPVGHLQPPLQSPWLVIHVSIAVLATSLFTLTTAMAILQLLQHNAARRAAEGRRTWSFLRLGAQRRRPRELVLPHQRGGFRDVDLHGDRRRHLGRGRVGPLLELGHQGGLVVRDLGGLRRLHARPRHPRLDGCALGLAVDHRLLLHRVQLHDRQHVLPGTALVRGAAELTHWAAGLRLPSRQPASWRA